MEHAFRNHTDTSVTAMRDTLGNAASAIWMSAPLTCALQDQRVMITRAVTRASGTTGNADPDYTQVVDLASVQFFEDAYIY